MMLLRNKIRKYVNESGIKAVIIDYLQLMTPPNARSREQEVSIMTRTLKKLSKIYDIPIIILAQLNRGVEQRGADAVPQLSDLRECLSVDTAKIYSKYGLSTVDSDSVNVLSVTKNNTVDSNVGLHIPKEPNDVYRITTKSGRYVDCTLNHKLITTSGKKYVKDLSVLDSLCVPTHFLNEDGRSYVEESRFIGWMIGNGSMVGSHSPSFITSCGVVSEDFCEYIEAKFGKRPRNHPHHSSDKVFQWDITFSDVRTKEGNPCTKWLRDNDLWGNQSYDKKIPDWYMSSADRQSICELMQGLIETDGCVIANSNRSKIRYSTTSKTLADQIIYLLASIGIVATINTYIKKEYRTIYNIDVDDTEMLNRFVQSINIRGYRGEKVKELKLDSRHNYLNNKLNRDTTLEIQSKLSNVKSKYRIQTHGNRRLTVKNAKEIILEHIDIMQEYLWMVADHYYWDAIKSIELIGQKEVFDLSVPCDNNFIVNGILSSNSGAIEQDADIVMFIHQGSIHVAKQRQGAVGIVPLDYNKTFTSFWDTSPAGITM
jgi:replicative DNA helicase